MIEIRYLQAESGANKFGTCNCCGKSSGEDPLMISVKFNYCGHGMTICLCDDCKKKLMEALLPANNSEIPNSSDTISRQAAIDALDKRFDSIPMEQTSEILLLRKDLRELPPATDNNVGTELGTNLAKVGTDCISRQAAIDALKKHEIELPIYAPRETDVFWDDAIDCCISEIEALPSAQPEIIHCRDCKYFELDHFEKVDEFPIPIIVAHEICMKWGEGCKSSVDGWCFMAERRTDE